MKSVRVVLAVVALLALPFGAVAAQSRGGSKPKPRAAAASEASTECKDQQAATLSRANDAGHDPYGLDKKCNDPVPPPPPPPPGTPPPPPPPPPGPPPSDTPPSGIHSAVGTIYEDVDGSGAQDVFAGELGMAGWTVQLYWNGQLVTSATTDADGKYVFPNLGNGSSWGVCVIPQAGYNRTQPVSGSMCGGDGVAFAINNVFMTWQQNDFGWMLQ